MGLFSALLTLPLAPARGVFWVADRMVEAAEQEALDPAVVRARLAALNRELEDGLIGEAEFEQAEEALLDLLEDGGIAGAGS